MFPLWTMTLIGFNLDAGGARLEPFRWTLIVISLSALFGLVYLLNQMKDREGDLANGKLAIVAQGLVSPSSQRITAAALCLISMAALLSAGFGRLGVWMAAVFVIAGLLYNYSPAALERTPWGGVLAGLGGSWLLLRLGAGFAGSNPALISESPYILAFTAGCILTGLPDVKGDRLTGKRTMVVVYGEGFTMGLALALISLAGVIAAFLAEWILVIAALGGGVFIAWGWLIGNRAYAVFGNKAAMVILAVGIGLSFPFFLLAIVLYYPFARWYHRVRFSLDYPGFKLS